MILTMVGTHGLHLILMYDIGCKTEIYSDKKASFFFITKVFFKDLTINKFVLLYVPLLP